MNYSHKKVVNSPINRSASKQLYSFPKATRFQNATPICDKFYNIRSSLKTEISPSMGYGKKSQLVVKNGVPGVGKYKKRTEFQLNEYLKRGYSFGMQQKKYTVDLKNPKSIPGPGEYKYNINKKFVNLSYSIHGKSKDNQLRHSNKLGPGQYQSINLNSSGKYYYSKFESSKCNKIGKSSRFYPIRVQSPGPGYYRAEQKLNINKDGIYFNSRLKTNPVNSFSRSNRPSIIINPSIPGPGTYAQFSEFAKRNKSASQIY